jgi:flagellar motor protein MotB
MAHGALGLVAMAAVLVLSGCGTPAPRDASAASLLGGAPTPSRAWSEPMEARRVALARALEPAGVEVARDTDNRLRLRWPADRAFATDSDQPSAAAGAVWTQVAAAFKDAPPSLQVRIQGHAEGGPQADRVAVLAMQRALRVRDQLRERGIPPAAMEVEAWGARAPLVVDDGTEAVRARNRRIELLVTD